VSTTLVAPRGASSDLPPADDSTRVVDPKRRLPGGRAILGGLLVACAALGLFALDAALHGPRRAFQVVVADVDYFGSLRVSPWQA
jgi:hypothetical protein